MSFLQHIKIEVRRTTQSDCGVEPGEYLVANLFEVLLQRVMDEIDLTCVLYRISPEIIVGFKGQSKTQ